MRLPRKLLSLLGICAIIFAGSSLHAQKIEGYHHSSWNAENGAPAPVRSLSQGPDGYIWIAAAQGLYRFDGVTFEKMPGLRDPELGDFEPRWVHASPSGDVWISYRPGAVALYRDGVLRDLHMPNPPEFVTRIEDDGNGGVWVVSGRDRGALAHFKSGKWQEMGDAQGVPLGQVHQVFIDRDHTTWVAQTKRLLFLRHGSRRFETTPAVIDMGAAIAQSPDGRLWLADRLGGVRPLPDYLHGSKDLALPAGVLPTGGVRKLLADKDGNLWSTDSASGLSRILSSRLNDLAARAHPDVYTAKDGLTSDRASVLLQDREGNIWVATETGLDKLRVAVVRPQKGIEQIATGYVGESDARGNIYLGSDAIYAVAPGHDARLLSTVDGELSSPCRARDGSVIEPATGVLLQLRPDGVTVMKGRAHLPYGCAQDAQGRLWTIAESDGLLWRDRTGWHPLPAPPELSSANGLTLAPSGVALAKLGSKYVMRLDPAKPVLVRAAAFGVGALVSVNSGSRDLLIGGSRGLARLRDGVVRIIDGDRYPWLDRLRSLAQTRRGDTWMLSPVGIVRVATSDLDRAFDRPGSPLPHDVFDAADGLTGRMQKDGLWGSQIIEGGDGAIRFLTSAGVMVVDPRTISRNALPPPVVVSSLTSGGTKYLDPKNVTLRAGAASVQIAYSALSLSIPERVRFRYKLEGVDDDWVDPGTRREAVYGNLAPGEYSFRVIAANNDGVWNRVGATLLFKVPPTFLQSIWFKLLCALGLGAVLWWAYTVRVRQVTTRLRAVMGVRLAERERIARELHDTLLQTFQGLVLQFQAAANRLPTGRPARDALDRALRSADAALVEGRNRVRELRVEGGDLTDRWIVLAAELGEQQPVNFELTVEGRPRPLHLLVQEELQRLGEEALRNAFQHANASAIKMTVGYRSGQLRLDIRDNGVGLPREVASRGERSGHYGLIGMRERARRIGGNLSIVSREGEGTEILLSVPGKAAYLKRGRRRWLPAFLDRKLDAR